RDWSSDVCSSDLAAWRSHGSCGRRANAPIAPKSYRSLHSRALECRPGSSRTRANEVSAMRRRAFVRSFAAEPPSASVRGGALALDPIAEQSKVAFGDARVLARAVGVRGVLHHAVIRVGEDSSEE